MEPVHQIQYIEIGIANEQYALRISDIYEIIKMQPITEIHSDKPYFKGVINMRGNIVPVISLRSRLGMPEEPVTKSNRIVVVKQTDEMIGIVVDRVTKVTTFSEIHPPPEWVGGVSTRYFEGIGLSSEALVGILMLDQVLHN